MRKLFLPIPSNLNQLNRDENFAYSANCNDHRYLMLSLSDAFKQHTESHNSITIDVQLTGNLCRPIHNGWKKHHPHKHSNNKLFISDGKYHFMCTEMF